MVHRHHEKGERSVIHGIHLGTVRTCAIHPGRYDRTIHACKYPCHINACHGNQPARGDPNYIHTWDGRRNLTLNIVDAHDPRYFSPVLFMLPFAVLDEAVRRGEEILLHCNVGHSRSPSILLAWLARAGDLPAESAFEAREAFHEIYPEYDPGHGIWEFLRLNWKEVINVSEAEVAGLL